MDHVPPGTATGIGSLPGTDPLDAARLVVDELPELPHLVELPDRGPAAGMVARAAALLAEMPVDLQPSGWRLVDRPGADLRRAQSYLRHDLDALEEVLDGYTGLVKLQATGPWTLAVMIEKNRGDKVLADHGARRDLAASLAEGLRLHVAEVARRVPGADVLLQLDEPGLPAVLRGDVPTVSGFGRLRAIDEAGARVTLRGVVEAPGVPVIVHCCAADVPVRLLREAGAAAVAFDQAVFPRTNAQTGELAEAVEAGVRLVVGVVPSIEPADGSEPSVRALRSAVAGFWRRLDQPAEALAGSVLVSPSCGLADASPAYARRALHVASETARAIADDPEPWVD